MLKKFFYLILASFLFYAAFYKLFIFAPGKIEYYTSSLLYPFLVAQKKIYNSISQWENNKKTNEQLSKELEALKLKNENLQACLLQATSNGQYVNSIESLAEFCKQYKSDKIILSQILLRNFDDANHFYIIDCGSNNGIEIDMAVVYKNCLVGRVIEVYPNWSKVILITDKKCKVSATGSNNRFKAIHVGCNNLNFTQLTFIDHLDNLFEGDYVLSQGEGLVFPRGFALGKIKSAKINGFEYEVKVESIIDFKNIDHCVVIQKGTNLDHSVNKELLNHISNVKRQNEIKIELDLSAQKEVQEKNNTSQQNTLHKSPIYSDTESVSKTNLYNEIDTDNKPVHDGEQLDSVNEVLI